MYFIIILLFGQIEAARKGFTVCITSKGVIGYKLIRCHPGISPTVSIL